jgi:hypothetical protein
MNSQNFDVKHNNQNIMYLKQLVFDILYKNYF